MNYMAARGMMEMKKTEPKPKILFDEFNTRFFDGRLPRYRIRIGIPSKPHMKGCIGYCDNSRKTIYLAPEILSDENELRRVLLHEMCHMRGGQYHGKRFWNRMEKVLSKGGIWIKDEIFPPNDPNIPLITWNEWQHNVANSIDDWIQQENAWKKGRPPSLHHIAAQLAAEMRISQWELLRICPWVRNRWRRAVKEERERRRLKKIFQKELEKSQGDTR